MAQKKFAIDNDKDKENFERYMRNNLQSILTDLRIADEDELAKKIEKEFVRLYSADFERMTELLYMLPDHIIKKVRGSLRKNRKSRGERGQKQMTVDRMVHWKLKKFADSQSVTLSQAIEKLLEDKKI